MVSKKPLIALLIITAVIALGAFALQTGADEPSSCIDCHTNADTMKAMVVVPELGGGEGEG
ncbi:MAG TPA: hypothetical protein PLI10_03580 [Bacillota bacterium]|nr:hypothetical protein [Bacillota bacterium]HOH10847.1 hypothetical protein [Bacillota bacterium]HOS50479.1 hypothetical protein [Bacillota bacterium]HOY88635.1 hypothetical protein [Bacillota bacterium]HPI00792.1 hypothetical protein [Bacillota bacterium]